MAKELVTLAKMDDFMAASLLKQMLDEAGIPAMVLGEKVADIFPGAVPVEVKVESDQLEEAKQILEAYEASKEGLDTEENFEGESGEPL